MDRRRWALPLVCATLALAGATGLSGCGSSAALAPLYPDLGDSAVFLYASGQGGAAFYATQAEIDNKPIRLAPGGRVTIDAECVGTGILHVQVNPGGEADNPLCYSTGGGGWSMSGPGKLPWPKTVTITTNKGTRWRVLVVDPYRSIGISDGG